MRKPSWRTTRLKLLLAAAPLACGALLVVSSARRAEAFDAMLAWKPVPEAAGYRLYAGSDTGCVSASVDVGDIKPGADGIVRAVIRDVPLQANSYFSVAAYDEDGHESQPSNAMLLSGETVLAVLGSTDEDASVSAALPNTQR